MRLSSTALLTWPNPVGSEALPLNTFPFIHSSVRTLARNHFRWNG